eukprot:TRINITY_DN2143_c0_g1_i5.p2 TRINITY_DN2143_c0_g1~~TRINITY_DN2143_c0_g1_i5.p2  ORF type:complete len:105 (+),score=22.29 TRINITY_DN2143_c0_g1_i5:130-444(+)
MSLSSLTTDVNSEAPEQDDFMIVIEETTNERQANYLKKLFNSQSLAHSIDEFEFVNYLGEGSYAKVIQVRHKETGNVFALKMISKKHIRKVNLLSFNSCTKRTR